MSDSTTREAAVEAVLALRDRLLGGLATERVALDGIEGRVLAEPVVSDRDVPAADRATMDGYAVSTGDDPPLAVREGEPAPGGDPPAHEPGTAREVATGGPLSRGADAVIPVEDAAVEDGSLVAADASAGQHVLARGSVVAAGETVLAAGRRLAPRDAVVARELGRDRLSVRARLSAAVLATGTEIHRGEEPDRDSEMLANLVASWGGDPTLAGSVPDDPGRVGERVAACATDHDVVVTTGGTSVGRADETAGAIGARANVRVADVALRPGSNTTVAWLPDGAVAVSLPGKPGAAFASATVLARPLFAGDTPSPTVSAAMGCDLALPDRDVEFVVPVEFTGGGTTSGDAPERTAVPLGHPASSVRLYEGRYRPHRVASCVRLSAADGFVLARRGLAAGETVAVVPYAAVEA